MAEWSLPDLESPINQYDTYQYATYPSYYHNQPVPRVPHCLPAPQAQSCMSALPPDMALHFPAQLQYDSSAMVPKGDNPREIRNKAEKMRRDRLNQSVAELAAMVPPVVAARRKIDKTTVLRLTAHYLRAHQYVFGDSIGQSVPEFNPASVLKVLSLFNGFLITTTYRGIIVVVSQNVQQYLGYTELDLLGQNLLNVTHEDDRATLRDQLMPKSQNLGPNGELMIPDEPDATRKVEEALAQEKRRFVIRLKKLGQRSEPKQYVMCHIEGSLRKSDRACRGYNRCCQIVRRARARSENPCSSGNDIVFIGIVRPSTETFFNESALESYRMEYRTRHSIDGEIIQCEARIALVTGYMTHEVSGVNAMNFMHRDDVRWVIIALREMYDQHRLFGESCYRLMTKNGQFIYMRTRGVLDVNQDSRAVTSFVCTNTVVNEDEGRHLIKLMRKKFTMMVNNNENQEIAEVEEIKDEDEVSEDQPAPVEDPRRLEKVILHLVTNLPSPAPQNQEDEQLASALPERSSSHRLTIIPPNKERIVSAIDKIYSVIKTFQKDPVPEKDPVEEIVDDQAKETVKYNNEESIKCNMEENVKENIEENVKYNIEENVKYNIENQVEYDAENHGENNIENQVEYNDENHGKNNIQNQVEYNTENHGENNIEHNNVINSVNELTLPAVVNAENLPTQQAGGIPLFENSDDISNFIQAAESPLLQSIVFNYAENEYNTETIFNNTTSPDLGYFDASPSAYDNMPPVIPNVHRNDQSFFSEKQVTNLHEIKYHTDPTMNMGLNGFTEEPKILPDLPLASNINFICGTKRSNDFDEELEVVYKKKNTEVVRDLHRCSGLNSPSLEHFFDDTLFGTQIERAINSLDTLDPAFPDLLVATDVQEILGKIESEANDKQLQNFNLSDYE